MEKMQPVIDFLWKVVEKYGTKALIACAAIYAIYQVVMSQEIAPERIPWAVSAVTVIAVAYFVVREVQERRQAQAPKEPPVESPPASTPK